MRGISSLGFVNTPFTLSFGPLSCLGSCSVHYAPSLGGSGSQWRANMEYLGNFHLAQNLYENQPRCDKLRSYRLDPLQFWRSNQFQGVVFSPGFTYASKIRAIPKRRFEVSI